MKNYAYLSKINKEKNINNFCEIMQENDGSITVKQGVVGKPPLVLPFTKHNDFNLLVEEKKLLGFSDVTLLHSSQTSGKTEALSYEPIEDKEVNDFITTLIETSRQFAKQNYSISVEEITDKMLSEAKSECEKLIIINNEYETGKIPEKVAVERFNDRLTELFEDIPRKIENFDLAFATSSADFSRIIEEEELKLENLKGIKANNEIEKEYKSGTVLEANGLKVRPCTYKEEDDIITHLGHDYRYAGKDHECERRFVKAYAVENQRTQKAFDNYVNEMGFSEKDRTIQYYYHGTKTENVYSIMSNGLSLNPDAKVTGKMFGNGIYFAPKAQKALNYMDTKYSRWNNGKNETGYTLIYSVALGKPFYPSHSNSHYNAENIPKGTHSIYAKKGTCGLVNDECIVFREDQSTVKYVMEMTHPKVRDLQFNLNRNELRNNLQEGFSDLKKTTDGLRASFNINALENNVSFELQRKIFKDYDMENVYIDYNSKNDTISFGGDTITGDNITLHPDLTGDDYKFMSREMKKAFAECENEWKDIVKSAVPLRINEIVCERAENNPKTVQKESIHIGKD